MDLAADVIAGMGSEGEPSVTRARPGRRMRPSTVESVVVVSAILLATSPTIGFYAVAIGLAIVAPQAAAFGYLLIAVVAVLRVRGDARLTRGSAAPLPTLARWINP